jgi:hypothetical protein
MRAERKTIDKIVDGLKFHIWRSQDSQEFSLLRGANGRRFAPTRWLQRRPLVPPRKPTITTRKIGPLD